jgi:hypothetical protein
MKTRDEPDVLHSGDMYFMFDNTVHHHQQQLLKCFTTATGDQVDKKEVKKIYLSIDEDTLRLRRGLVRQGASFDQIEILSVCTASDIHSDLPMLPRCQYKGTNLGNKIGDIELPDLDTLWKLSCKQKIALHGVYRVAVGGRTPGEEDSGPGRGQKRKTMDTVEPVFWHARPLKLYKELLGSYKLAAIIDLTTGDGTLATHCAKSRIPYMGFTLSETHSELLKHRCVSALLESSCVEGEDLL